MTGYLDPRYAEALSEFGSPRPLAASEGWVLIRPIPRSDHRDAMGCYPLFACRTWSALRADLDSLDPDLASVALVTDPFGSFDPDALAGAFPAVCEPFKEHFVVELRRARGLPATSHHRRNLRRAVRAVEVEVCRDPHEHAATWIELYRNLIERHEIGGLAAFSPASLARQLEVPGLVMLRAVHRAETVGITLWYRQQGVAYYHLGAYSETGYTLGASFVLFAFAIDHFAGDADWLCLGAGAGAAGSGTDGLTRFKSGWATGTRTAYFCGRIINPRRYAEVCRARGAAETRYFPAYRQGEFASSGRR